jgi:hypothetical protein
MTRTISNATAALIRRLLWDVRRPLLAGVASRRATQIAGSGAARSRIDPSFCARP